MTAAQQLQQMHDQQQADLASLTKWQRIEYSIARREMTHADALAKVTEK
jgi:hypothetical protein